MRERSINADLDYQYRIHSNVELVNSRRAHALARVTVVGLCVCLSGLNLLLQASRDTRYYTYVFFTMNARFNMCGVR